MPANVDHMVRDPMIASHWDSAAETAATCSLLGSKVKFRVGCLDPLEPKDIDFTAGMFCQ